MGSTLGQARGEPDAPDEMPVLETCTPEEVDFDVPEWQIRIDLTTLTGQKNIIAKLFSASEDLKKIIGLDVYFQKSILVIRPKAGISYSQLNNLMGFYLRLVPLDIIKVIASLRARRNHSGARPIGPIARTRDGSGELTLVSALTGRDQARKYIAAVYISGKVEDGATTPVSPLPVAVPPSSGNPADEVEIDADEVDDDEQTDKFYKIFLKASEPARRTLLMLNEIATDEGITISTREQNDETIIIFKKMPADDTRRRFVENLLKENAASPEALMAVTGLNAQNTANLGSR